MPFPYGSFVGAGAGGGTAAFLGSGGGSSFLNTFGAGLAGGFAQSFGTALGSQLLGEDGFNKSDLAYSHHKDIETYKRIRNSNFRFQTKKGLNAYEALMGPQGGGETGPTASGQVLGNAKTAEMQQDRADARAAFQAGLDRQMALQQTAMQTEAQKYSADKAAEASGYQADRNYASQALHARIKMRSIALDEKIYDTISVPAAAANLAKTQQEVKKLINEVVTSRPDFLKAMKLLSMGVENSIQTLLLNGQPFDITSRESLLKATPDQKAQMLMTMVGVNSHLYKESTGLQLKTKEELIKFFEASLTARSNMVPDQTPSPTLGIPIIENGKWINPENSKLGRSARSMLGGPTMDGY